MKMPLYVRTHREFLISLLLMTAILAVFWQVGGHDFIMFDDPDYITQSPHVRTGLSLQNLYWAFTATHAYNWHPLTWISHMADCQLFGLNAGRHHLVNVFFHIANTILLFLILNRMTRALWQSAFVAALFALHPLHVESVAWAAERKDVLSTLFWMLTMGAYAFYVEQPSTRRYLPTLLFFALGLMAKPMLVTLPFVLLLLDYWPLKRLPRLSQENQQPAALQVRESKKQKKKPKGQVQEIMPAGKLTAAKNAWPMIRHLLWEKTPFFLLAALSSIITVYAQQQIVKPLEVYPFMTRLANALVSYASYILKMLDPTHLAVFYPYAGNALPFWKVGGAVLLLAAVTILAIRIRRRPYLIVGWLWYLGTLVPVIGLVQVGLQAMADRYTYVPFIGIFIMLAWGLPDLLRNLPYQKKVIGAAAGIVILAASAFTYAQVSYWKNDITLFQHACDVTTDNYWAHYNLGLALVQKGDMDGALNHFQETSRIKPNEPDPFNNIGIILAKRGHLEKAVSYFSEALRRNPSYQNARANLELTLSQMARSGKKIPLVDESSIRSRDPESYYGLGVDSARKGDLSKAISYFLETLRIKPDHYQAHNDIGVALAQTGRLDEAIRHFREAIKIKPDFKPAHQNLEAALRQKKKNSRF